MIDTVYMFYNGDNSYCPPSNRDRWINHQNPDEKKLAWLCSESWIKNRWKVNRLVLAPHYGSYWHGALKMAQYPFMHFLPNLQLAMEEGKMPDPCLITTSDVFNRGLTPGMLGALLEIKAWKGKYVSFSNGFTMATGLFTLDVVRAMNVTLGRFDAGKLKIASEFIADEHLLRQAEFPCLMLDVMSHAPDFTSKPLIHLSRSTLQWFDKWYPETVTI